VAADRGRDKATGAAPARRPAGVQRSIGGRASIERNSGPKRAKNWLFLQANHPLAGLGMRVNAALAALSGAFEPLYSP
jgi:hypothetical protein